MRFDIGAFIVFAALIIIMLPALYILFRDTGYFLCLFIHKIKRCCKNYKNKYKSTKIIPIVEHYIVINPDKSICLAYPINLNHHNIVIRQ